MAKKQKACLDCRAIYEGTKCPNCSSTASSDNSKGRVFIFNTTESEVSKNMKLNQKGEFAIKTK